MNILVVGYYNHCNLGDEQYKWSIKHILNRLPHRIPQSVEFIDCDKLIDYTIPDNCTIMLGGGDVLNHYFLDKLNKKISTLQTKPKILAFSVGIPYNSIFLQPENLKKLDIFDHIYLRTRQDIPVFSQFFDSNKLSYLPDASCFLPDAFDMKSPSSYFTPLTSPIPPAKTDCSNNNMYRKLYGALYSLHKTKKIINVNFCRHIYHPQYVENYEAIVRELARFLEELTKKGYYLVLLPFNTKPTGEGKTDDTNCENDILIHNDVLRHIKNHTNIINIDYELSLCEILSLYPLFYMSLPMRFHGTLFSINAAVPMIPIYTTKKIRNALLDIGWKHEYVFEKNEKDLPLSFNPKKMMMTFLDCVRHHAKGKILLKNQFENFKRCYDKEKIVLETRIFSPVRVSTLMQLTGLPPPPTPPKNSNDDLYDAYFSSPLAPKFSENPIYSQKVGKDDDLIETVYSKLQAFAKDHQETDFRDITDPTLKNVAVCVVSYFLTGHIDSQYHHGLMQKMFSPTYEYKKEWKWVLQHYKTKGKQKPVLPENPDGPFNIGYIDQNDQSGVHRSGWAHVYEHLLSLNNSTAPTLLDLYLDRTFHWKRDIYREIGIIPYRQSWVGFVHHTFDQTFSEYNNSVLLNCPEFIESLPHCRGIIVLSQYLKSQFEEEFKIRNINVPVHVLVHPTETDVPQFDMQQFYDNPDKKLIHIGGWLRNIFSFYQLELNPQMMLKKSEMVDPPKRRCFINLRNILRRDRTATPHHIRKVALKGKYMENYYPPEKLGDRMANILKTINTSKDREPMFCSQTNLQNNWLKHLVEYLNSIEQKMDVMNALDNKEYDNLLTNNTVFLNLVDGSAVNTIIECVVRNTPVFVNKHPAVVGILGKNYPLYYDKPSDINQLLADPICIRKAHDYMKGMDKTPYQINTFIQTLQRILSV
jgi:hypothetical protein